jgi:hypothetical protein
VLLHSARTAEKNISNTNATPITCIKPGDIAYVDLRSYGYDWSASLGLNDFDNITYVIPMRCISLHTNNTRADMRCDLFEITYNFKHYSFVAYAYHRELKENMFLVDKALCLQFPELIPEEKRKRLLARFKNDD